MKDVIAFLELNGFVRTGESEYTNESCIIRIEDSYYEVEFESNGVLGSMYSKDFNIYWLIGVLTYYGLMDKNYSQLNEPNEHA